MIDLLPSQYARSMMLIEIKREHRRMVKEMETFELANAIPRRCTDRRFSPEITTRES